jgi:dynein heavy chain
LESKYVQLVTAYGLDLKIVQDVFLRSKKSPPIANNLPPISGALFWCRGLIERIQVPMLKLNMLDRTILEREETKEVSKVYLSIITAFTEYENEKIEEWGKNVEATSINKLNQSLLIRDNATRTLTVNFDPALVRLLREVKYFLLLGLDVPEAALKVYQQVETFRSWTGNMDLIVNMNNEALDILLPVERPLILPFLTKFDATVEKGITTLNWKSSGISEFITETMDQVKIVSEIVNTMKGNLRSIHDTLSLYNKPLLARKNKPMTKEEFEREHKVLFIIITKYDYYIIILISWLEFG